MKTKDIVVNCDGLLYLEEVSELVEEVQHSDTFLANLPLLQHPFSNLVPGISLFGHFPMGGTF